MPKDNLDENLLTVWVVAGVVIKKDDKYLLVQEASKGIRGLWNLPAGKAEKGSTLIETAAREAKEETGFDVEIIKQLGVYHEDGDRSVRHAYEAKIIGGQLCPPADEILDAKWYTYDEVIALKDKLRSNWILKAIDQIK